MYAVLIPVALWVAASTAAMAASVPWHIRQALEELAEELLGSRLIAPMLDENIEDMTILIYPPPEVVTCSVDGQKHLIQVPLDIRSGASMPELVRIRLPKLPTSIAHGLVCEHNAAFGHQLFNVAIGACTG
jgi:hypothetical protein